MNINRGAPAVAESEIEIAAARNTVWNVLTAFERWPDWNPAVKTITIAGEVAPGTQFRWKSGPGTITSTIKRVEEPRLIGWTGTTIGIKGVHVWQLESRDGRTIVRTQESWDGLLVRALRKPMQKSLQRGLDSGLSHLKAVVERGA